MIYDVCVIGGGASGLAAAIAAGREGASVLVIERMDKTGKKILATGNGKCNLTNQAIRRGCISSGVYRSGRRCFRFMYWRILMPVIHWLFLNPWGFIQKREMVMYTRCLNRPHRSGIYCAGNWQSRKPMW